MHTETTTAIDPTTTTHAPIAFPDGEFRLFCASFGSAYGDARKVFRVRVDRDPHERAAEKGIRGYDRIVAVLDPELIGAWVASHPGREPRGLPAPRPDSCDACERPLERHEVAIFELRGTPVVGLCAAACWEAALDRLSSSEDRHAHPDCERNQMIVLTTASPGVRLRRST